MLDNTAMTPRSATPSLPTSLGPACLLITSLLPALFSCRSLPTSESILINKVNLSQTYRVRLPNDATPLTLAGKHLLRFDVDAKQYRSLPRGMEQELIRDWEVDISSGLRVLEGSATVRTGTERYEFNFVTHSGASTTKNTESSDVYVLTIKIRVVLEQPSNSPPYYVIARFPAVALVAKALSVPLWQSSRAWFELEHGSGTSKDKASIIEYIMKPYPEIIFELVQ